MILSPVVRWICLRSCLLHKRFALAAHAFRCMRLWIDLLTRVFRVKIITCLQTFLERRSEEYIAWFLVWMYRFVSCTCIPLKRITCLHKFTERSVHCIASCVIYFVCKRVSSHKSNRLSEGTDRVNSCQVVTTWRHISIPIHSIWPFPVSLVRLPVGYVNFR